MNAELFICYYFAITHLWRIIVARRDSSREPTFPPQSAIRIAHAISREFMRKTFRNYLCWTRETRFSFFWNNEFFRFPFLPRKCASHSPHRSNESPIASMQSIVASLLLSVHETFLFLVADRWLKCAHADLPHTQNAFWSFVCYVREMRKPTEFMTDGEVDLAKYWLWLRLRATITHIAYCPLGRSDRQTDGRCARR